MKENKISIEITADGWKTDVTINGKTYFLCEALCARLIEGDWRPIQIAA